MDVLPTSEAADLLVHQTARDTKNAFERARRAWKRFDSEDTRKALDEARKAKNLASSRLNKLHAPKPKEEEWTYQTVGEAAREYASARWAWKQFDSKDTRDRLDEARKAKRLAIQHPDNAKERRTQCDAVKHAVEKKKKRDEKWHKKESKRIG